MNIASNNPTIADSKSMGCNIVTTSKRPVLRNDKGGVQRTKRIDMELMEPNGFVDILGPLLLQITDTVAHEPHSEAGQSDADLVF